MTKLDQFRKTPAGKAILSGAVFVSIFASPAYASLGTRDVGASASVEQTIPLTRSVEPSISTAQLTEMLATSINDLKGYTLALQSRRASSERQLFVLKAMEGLVDDVNGLFQADLDELSPVEKVTLARRIVENNLRLAKERLSLEPVTDEGVELSKLRDKFVPLPSYPSQLASNRQTLLDAIEETRVDIDYVIDEIAKSQNESAYYRETLQQVTELLEGILITSRPTEAMLQANFAALKAWQKDLRDEMESTEDEFSAAVR